MVQRGGLVWSKWFRKNGPFLLVALFISIVPARIVGEGPQQSSRPSNLTALTQPLQSPQLASNTDIAAYSRRGSSQARAERLTRIAQQDPVWQTNLSQPPQPIQVPAVAVGHDGNIYVFGGELWASRRELDTTYIYHPSTDKWTVGKSMPVARTRGRAVTLPDGRIAVLGGGVHCGDHPNWGPICHYGTVYSRVDVYTPSTDSWGSLAPMLSPRYDFSAVLYHERIYAIAGSDGTNVLGSVEAYDPASNRWSEVTGLPHPVLFTTAVLDADGNIALIGGIDSVDAASSDSTTYLYDGRGWRGGPTLPYAVHDSEAARGSDGLFYVIGGYQTSNGGGAYLSTVEAYDARARTWKSEAPLPTPAVSGVAVTTSDGQIYLVGGVTAGNSTASVFATYKSANKTLPSAASCGLLTNCALASGNQWLDSQHNGKGATCSDKIAAPWFVPCGRVAHNVGNYNLVGYGPTAGNHPTLTGLNGTIAQYFTLDTLSDLQLGYMCFYPSSTTVDGRNFALTCDHTERTALLHNVTAGRHLYVEETSAAQPNGVTGGWFGLFHLSPHQGSAAHGGGACPQTTTKGDNFICNPGFDASVPLVTAGAPPKSSANWIAFQPTYHGTGSTLTQITAPVHGSLKSASVQILHQATGAYFYQDLPQLAPTASYKLTFWVYPSSAAPGDQHVQLMNGWDRSHGSMIGSDTIAFSSQRTALSAWGQRADGLPLRPDAWHQVTLRADTCTRTVQVDIDGIHMMTTAPGTVPSSGAATLLVGQGASQPPSSSTYYYDDFSLTALPCTQTGEQPHITGVDFSGTGQDLHIVAHGSGFGRAPVPMPYTGDIPGTTFYFDDITHDWTGGDLSVGVTLRYVRWADSEIIIDGFSGGYGGNGGAWVDTPGDKVQIRVTNVDSSKTTTWEGTLPAGPSYRPTGNADSAYARAVLTDHPVAYWPLDDTMGAMAKDATGHGHDGRYIGNVRMGELGPLGAGNTVASFDGSSGYVNIPGTWGGPSWKAVTVEAWVYARVLAPQAVVGPTDFNFQAIVEPTNQSFVHFQLHPPCRVEDECGDVVYVDSGTRAVLLPVVSPSSPRAWHYVVMTGQSGGSKIYVDGVEQGSNSSTFTSITAANSLRIGSGYRGGRFFNGRIADVAIYDHTLDAVQVADHYNVAKGLSSGSGGGVVVFVHGIMGDYTRMGLDPNNLDYTALLSSVLAAGYAIKPFAYYEDTGLAMGHHIGDRCSPQQYTPLSHALIDEIRHQRALYVDADATSHLEASQPQDILNLKCNSESDLATNVVMLDHFLNTIASHATKITVMVHSMGGAITRGWLAYAQYREDHGDYDPALHRVKSVIFMQGAQQGATEAWLGGQCQVGWQFDFWSLLYQALCHAVGAKGFESFSHLDGLSAAARELVPGSAWYRQTNSLPLPRGIHYFNFYSDIRVHPFLKADPDHPIYPQMIHAGDLVMPPGSDDPRAIGTENLNTSSDFYPNGGARFCPPSDCHEWQIEDGSELNPGSVDVPPYPFPLQIASIGPVGVIYHGPFPLHAGPVVQRIGRDGATHFNFGGNGMGALVVNVSDCNNPATHHLRRLVTQVMAILRDPTTVCAHSAENVGSAATGDVAGNPLKSISARMVAATAWYQLTSAHERLQQALSSKAAQPAAVPLVLRDRASREAFTLYPKKATRRYASPYSFSVAGAGLYLGQIIVTPKPRNTASIQAHGLARWVRSGRVDVRLSLRIGGHIDLASGQATLDIQVFRPHASYRYHLQTVGVQPRAVQPLVRRVDALIQTRRLSALYPLLPSFFQTAAVRLQLAHSSVHARGMPTILAMTSTGGGQVVQTSLGYSFYVQPIVVRERSSSGVERTYTSALEFIWINGAWRFWSSE